MTTPNAPLWLVPSQPGMLCNLHGASPGPVAQPAVTPSGSNFAAGTNLPAGSYVVAVTYVLAGETTPGPQGSITISSGDQITWSVTVPVGIWRVNFYLIAAPATVTLGLFGTVFTGNAGAASQLLNSKTQPSGVSAPTVNGSAYDGIPISFRYSTPNSASRAASIRINATRIGSGGQLNPAGQAAWSTFWLGTPGTQALPGAAAILPVGPNGCVYYQNRVYVLFGTGGSKLGAIPFANCAGAIASAPANGGSIGSWRWESPVPQYVTFDGCKPGALFVIGGNLYALTQQTIMYAPILGDGTLGSWQVGAQTGSTGFGATMTGFDKGNNLGGFLYVFYAKSSAKTDMFVVNADGSLAAASAQTALPVNNVGGAAWFDPNGNLLYLGGEAYVGGAPVATVYYSSVDVAGGAMTSGWTASGSPLPAVRSRFGFCTDGGDPLFFSRIQTGAVGTFISNAATVYIFGGVAASGGAGQTTSWYANALALSGAGAGNWHTGGPALPSGSYECGAAYVGDFHVYDNMFSNKQVWPNSSGDTQRANAVVGGGTGGGVYTTDDLQWGTTFSAWFQGNAPALVPGPLGQGGVITLNADGTEDITVMYGQGSSAISVPLAFFADGDIVQLDVQILDQYGDPSVVKSTILKIGQPPIVTSLSPASNAQVPSPTPTLSFLYGQGPGGGQEATYRFQVFDASGAQLIDTGLLKDARNNYQATISPHLNLAAQPLAIYATTSSVDTPLNDGVSTNLAAAQVTGVRVGAAQSVQPFGLAASVDNVNGLVNLTWSNPPGTSGTPAIIGARGPGAVPRLLAINRRWGPASGFTRMGTGTAARGGARRSPSQQVVVGVPPLVNRVYFRVTGQSAWQLLKDNVPATASVSMQFMDQLSFGVAYDFAVSTVNPSSGESAMATGPTGITISPSYQFDQSGYHAMVHVAGFTGMTANGVAAANHLALYLVAQPEFQRQLDTAAVVTFGATGATARYGPYSYRLMKLVLSQTTALLQAVAAFLQLVQQTGPVLCYRDTAGYLIYCHVDLQHASKHTQYIDHEMNLVEAQYTYTP